MNADQNGEKMLQCLKGMKFNFLQVLGLLLLLSIVGCTLPGGLSSTETGVVAPPDSRTTFFFNTLNFIFMGFFAYYFIVLKPKSQEEDTRKKFFEGLSKNDEVVTTGGLIGRVVQKKLDIVTIEISPKINIKVLATEIRPMVSEVKSGEKSE